MAATNLNHLVLNGASLTGNVVTGWNRRIGGYQADGLAPAFRFSMRHPSSSRPTESKRDRHHPVVEHDADHAARAGRSGSWSGALSRRSLASCARQAIQQRWPLASVTSPATTLPGSASTRGMK